MKFCVKLKGDELIIEYYEIILYLEKIKWGNESLISSSTPQQAAELLKRKQLIEEKLEKSGKRKEYEEYLKKRLVESGWKDEMKKQCMGI